MPPPSQQCILGNTAAVMSYTEETNTKNRYDSYLIFLTERTAMLKDTMIGREC